MEQQESEKNVREKKPLRQRAQERTEEIAERIKAEAGKAILVVKNHKAGFIIGAIATFGFALYVGSNEHEKNQLKQENTQLKIDNAQHEKEHEEDQSLIDACVDKIVSLKNLCEEKDEYTKKLASDGLRHGSSVASECMNDRKAYLNEQDAALQPIPAS